MGVIVRQKFKGKGQPWWVFITHNGKRTSRKVGAKDAAKKVAAKIEAKLQLGEFGFEQQRCRVQTFKEYSDSWIKTTVPATCKESTLSDYGMGDYRMSPFADRMPPKLKGGHSKEKKFLIFSYYLFSP